ncbi:hypothetical protein GCM10007874_11210 [Labrys miyagiensis]|uniref:Uncharacterized protein n=1 Tax=Labrys miyagiensis TaxID=346912 RepID=A0ABQ6CDV7_9HYPH|nr:hypothetical protein [Labrys miyagiensis]GLS18105.1 hypothetical protein GCM10007874_11210 [Labrys miyagiensis]
MGKPLPQTYNALEPGRHHHIYDKAVLAGTIIQRDEHFGAYSVHGYLVGRFCDGHDAIRSLITADNIAARHTDIPAGIQVAFSAGANIAERLSEVEGVLRRYTSDPAIIGDITSQLMIPLAVSEAAMIRTALRISGATQAEAELGYTKYIEGFAIASTPSGGNA